MDSLEFMSQYDVPFIKIPSALLTDLDLINAATETGKFLILSTGMSTLEEIDKTIETLKGVYVYYSLRDSFHHDFMLLHCNSTYPAPENELNLRVISTLKDRYHCPVGYSGHEKYLEPPLIAITLGARVIERHITLDHDMWGTDHSSSLEVFAMDMLRKRCDKVLDMLGTDKKIVTDSEIKVREKLRPNG